MANPKDIVVDFKGEAPVQSLSRFDKVPIGTYVVKVASATLAYSRAENKPMVDCSIEISRGSHRGRNVRDMLVLPRKGTKDNRLGLQRLNGLIVAVGLKAQTGKVSVAKIAKSLQNREAVCEIGDGEMQATEDYPARTFSQPYAYYAIKSEEGKARLKALVKGRDEPTDNDEGEGDEDVADEDGELGGDDEGDDDDGDDEEEEEKPRRKKSKKSKKSKRATVEDDDDDDTDDDGDGDDEDGNGDGDEDEGDSDLDDLLNE